MKKEKKMWKKMKTVRRRRQGKAGSTLIALSIIDLVIHWGKVKFAYLVKMLTNKNKKKENVIEVHDWNVVIVDSLTFKNMEKKTIS